MGVRSLAGAARAAAGMLVLTLLLPTSPARAEAADDTVASAEAAQRLAAPELFSLLSAGTAKNEREVLMQRVIAAAQAGSGWDTFLVGVLFRHGKRHPSQIAPQNIDVARDWLQRCLRQSGCPSLALASLAELELEAGRPASAMAWAQGYAFIQREVERQRIEHGLKPASGLYSEELVDAAYRALPAEHREAMTSGFLAAVKKDLAEVLSRMIADDLANELRAHASTAPRLTGRRRGYTSHYQPTSGSGLYLLRVSPEGGRATGAVLIEALPHPGYVGFLGQMVSELEFSSYVPAAGEESMYLSMPMNYVSRTPMRGKKN